ncbi:restriction endonuclease subunit S [Serratia proteamaculans]|uniref:restriction endonuclease subunit S n=1 Tax=Serratia proteamaculans TaxID=28151 RepID=UPI0039B1018F
MAVEQLITQHIDTWTSALRTRSTAGRGTSGKIDLYGIKKLRELILELAVRGKLVPQDPNDEPASELLKRIAAEKAELVKQGKIKKQKPLPEISEEEKPFELPVGWEWTSLCEISEINPKIEVTDDDQEISFVPMPCVSTRFDGVHEQEIRKWIEVKKGYTHFANNDIALAKITPCFENSKAAIFSGLKNGVGVGTTELHVARPCSSELNLQYILLNIKSPNFLRVGESRMTGSAGQKRVPKAFFESYPLPFPPMAEQVRIVDKFSQLMTICDQLEQQSLTSLEAHSQLVETLLSTLTDSQNAEELAENWARISQHFDTLFTTEASIDALKQTILQLAVMGKLVPQDPNDEPASELLKRIEQEKAQLVKEGKIKKQKPLPPVSDEEKPFELPVGWEWCRIGDIIENMDAGWSPACLPEPSPNEKVWGVLKTTAVQTLEYREQENKTLPNSKQPRPQYEVKVGDILITRAGPKNRVGISCLVGKTRGKLMISDKIIRFHLISADISAKYISLCLNCGVTAEYLESSKSGMAESQMNISQDNLKFAPVALPPTKIQLKVILTVEDFFSTCDSLKSRLQSAQQTQLHLADALTDAALS